MDVTRPAPNSRPSGKLISGTKGSSFWTTKPCDKKETWLPWASNICDWPSGSEMTTLKDSLSSLVWSPLTNTWSATVF